MRKCFAPAAHASYYWQLSGTTDLLGPSYYGVIRTQLGKD